MATEVDAAQRDAFAERLFGAALGAYELATVHLGDRLGYYRALAEHGESTSAELAASTARPNATPASGSSSRRSPGSLEVDDARRIRPSGGPPGCPRARGKFWSTKDRSLAHLTPLRRFGVAFAHVLPAVEEAFRSGGGVSWEDFGVGREAQADANRPVFANLLGSEWLPSIADVHERLDADPPPRRRRRVRRRLVEHRGRACVPQGDGGRLRPGRGLRGASRRANLAVTGIEADLVSFQHRDAGDPELAGSYQLVTVFEALHDMSQPVEVLRAPAEPRGGGRGRRSSWTSASPTRSRLLATRSSG